MESIKELREICQGPRRKTDDWHKRYISRKPSIYITWALLHTPLTANGATFLFLLAGIIASLVFAPGTKYAFLAGGILLQLWYVMDMVDGEIARYRKQTSSTGIYFDYIIHYIVHPFVFVCIGLGLYNHYADLNMLFLSVLAGYSVCMVTVSSDVFNAVFYQEAYERLQKYPDNPNLLRKESGMPAEKKGMLRKLFSGLHLICTFPSIMNVIFLVSVVNLFVNYNLMFLLIKFYAVSATFVWIARIFVFVKNRKIDNELAKL